MVRVREGACCRSSICIGGAEHSDKSYLVNADRRKCIKGTGFDRYVA
jgi:hypothetical protein